MAEDGRSRLGDELRGLKRKAEQRRGKLAYGKLAKLAVIKRRQREPKWRGSFGGEAVKGWCLAGKPAAEVGNLLALVEVLHDMAGASAAPYRKDEWLALHTKARAQVAPQRPGRDTRAIKGQYSVADAREFESAAHKMQFKSGSDGHAVSPRNRIIEVEILESNVFAKQTILFDGLTALVGPHGSGKSVLLKALYRAFGQRSSSSGTPLFVGEEHEFDQTAVRAVIRMSVEIDGNRFDEIVDLAKADDLYTLYEESSQWLLRNRWKELIGEFGPEYYSVGQMFGDMHIQLQNYGPVEQGGNKKRWIGFENFERTYEYTEDQLNRIGRILGRRYRSVDVYQENRSSDLLIIAKTFEGRSIEQSMMSFGEFWVHWLLAWDSLDPASMAPRLIDEPETFLAPAGHGELIDELIRRSLESENQLIISTHSPDILVRFPLKNIRLCIPTSDGIRVEPPRSVPQIREALGLRHPLRAVLLVEDALAKIVVDYLLETLDDRLLREVEVAAAQVEVALRHETASSTDVVLDTLESLRSVRRIVHIGVLGGQNRSANSKLFDGCLVCFLPGAGNLSGEFISVVNQRADELAEAISVSTSEILTAMRWCSGFEGLNWVTSLADHLGRDKSRVLCAILELWLEVGEIENEAINMVNEIRTMVY